MQSVKSNFRAVILQRRDICIGLGLGSPNSGDIWMTSFPQTPNETQTSLHWCQETKAAFPTWVKCFENCPEEKNTRGRGGVLKTQWPGLGMRIFPCTLGRCYKDGASVLSITDASIIKCHVSVSLSSKSDFIALVNPVQCHNEFWFSLHSPSLCLLPQGNYYQHYLSIVKVS